MRRDVMKSPLDHVYDYGSTPLTRPERQLLELYATDATFHGFQTYCGTCPQIHRGRGVRAVCCRLEHLFASKPTWSERMKARLRCLV